MNDGCDRRDFLKGSLLTSASLKAAAMGGVFATTAAWADQTPTNPLPKRALGKTGYQATIFGLGGLYTVSMHDHHKEAVEIIHRALDLGVNYVDTSARYGTGASELNIGTVMKTRRNEVFLASKSHDPTYDGTMALFKQSLLRLQTDHLDLYQHHALGTYVQLKELQQKNSARQAFEKLRADGQIRYIGVTGHSSRLLADALEDYPYDTALITLNAAQEVMDNPEDLDRFFRVAKERNVGVIAMKVVARGVLISERHLDMRQLLPYTLSHPVTTAIVGHSLVSHLEENIRIASNFRQLTESEIAEIRQHARAKKS
jgi:aryl-alcohol dehydrogenase-like predicted oxidoreductase